MNKSKEIDNTELEDRRSTENNLALKPSFETTDSGKNLKS